MIRIPTVLGLGLLAAGLVAGVFLVGKVQQIAPRAAESLPTPQNTTISNINDQSFVVSWTTSSSSTGFLEVGRSGQTPARKVPDDRDKNVTSPGFYSTHYVTVDALQPDTTYSFRIGEGLNSFFDQNGAPFSATTGPEISANQISDLAQGTVATAANQPARGAVVYAQLPGAQLLSALVSTNGNWIVPLSTARISDLSNWTMYDRMTTIYAIRVEGGADGRSDVILTTASDRPTSPIVLGQSYDFRQSTSSPPAQATLQTSGTAEPEQSGSVVSDSLFEFSSLGPVTPVSSDVTLENPGKNGEVIGADKPEFFGKGPVGTPVDIIVKSSQTISGNVNVSSTGTWSFSPPSALAPGAHDITIKWTDTKGILQTLTRSFIVNAAGGPAFTSTPSATPRPDSGQALKPTGIIAPLTPTPTTKPRSIVPPGTPPQSGNLTPSALFFIIGSLFTIAGAALVRAGAFHGR